MKSYRKFLLQLFVLVLTVAAGKAAFAGQDEGLYDEVPPEGSAFVRFIDAQLDEDEWFPVVNGKKRDGVRFGGVKPYGVVAHGKVAVELAGATLDFDAEAGGYYTVILQNKALRVVKDPKATDDLKAQILVYNLTGRDDVSLKTADGKVSVVGPVKAGEMAERAVNPIKVSFAVYAGEEKYADLNDWPLERQESYVVAIFDNNGEGKATYDRARVSAE